MHIWRGETFRPQRVLATNNIDNSGVSGWRAIRVILNNNNSSNRSPLAEQRRNTFDQCTVFYSGTAPGIKWSGKNLIIPRHWTYFHTELNNIQDTRSSRDSCNKLFNDKSLSRWSHCDATATSSEPKSVRTRGAVLTPENLFTLYPRPVKI